MSRCKCECPKRERPDRAAVEKNYEESEAHFAKTMTAFAVAGKWRVTPKPKQDRHETVECPICKGKLGLFQSSYNGHVHGKCETPNCVAWME
jgi:hypothetical protein